MDQYPPQDAKSTPARRATASAQTKDVEKQMVLGVESESFLKELRTRILDSKLLQLLEKKDFVTQCQRVAADIDRNGGFERVYGTNAWASLDSFTQFNQSHFKDVLTLKEFFQKFLLRFFFKREFPEEFNNEIDEKLYVEPNWVEDPAFLKQMVSKGRLFHEYDSVLILRDFFSKWGFDKSLYSLESIKRNYGHTRINVIEQNPKGESFQTQSSEMFQKRVEFTVGKYIDYQQEMRNLQLNSSDFQSTKIKFGVNIDIGDWAQIMGDLENNLPDWIRFKSPKDVLKFVRQEIEGITLPQLYLKVAGSWTGGHEENLRIMAVNINTGQGDVEWHCVPPEDVQVLRKHVLDTEGVDIHKMEGLWFTHYVYCLKAGVRVMKWIQQPGDIVVLRPGTLHWVRSCSVTTNVAWNLTHFRLEDFQKIDLRYQINRKIEFKTIIANKTLFLDVLNNGYEELCRESLVFIIRRLRGFVDYERKVRKDLFPESVMKKLGIAAIKDDINTNNIIFCSECYNELFMFWGLCEESLPDGFFCLHCFKTHVKYCKHKTEHELFQKYEAGHLQKLFALSNQFHEIEHKAPAVSQKVNKKEVLKYFQKFIVDLNKKDRKGQKGPLVPELAADKFYIGRKENEKNRVKEEKCAEDDLEEKKGKPKEGEVKSLKRVKGDTGICQVDLKGRTMMGADSLPAPRQEELSKALCDEVDTREIPKAKKKTAKDKKKKKKKVHKKSNKKKKSTKLKKKFKKPEVASPKSVEKEIQEKQVKLGKRQFFLKTADERKIKNVQIGNRKKAFNIFANKAYFVKKKKNEKEELIYELNKMNLDDDDFSIKRKKQEKSGDSNEEIVYLQNHFKEMADQEEGGLFSIGKGDSAPALKEPSYNQDPLERENPKNVKEPSLETHNSPQSKSKAEGPSTQKTQKEPNVYTPNSENIREWNSEMFKKNLDNSRNEEKSPKKFQSSWNADEQNHQIDDSTGFGGSFGTGKSDAFQGNTNNGSFDPNPQFKERGNEYSSKWGGNLEPSTDHEHRYRRSRHQSYKFDLSEQRSERFGEGGHWRNERRHPDRERRGFRYSNYNDSGRFSKRNDFDNCRNEDFQKPYNQRRREPEYTGGRGGRNFESRREGRHGKFSRFRRNEEDWGGDWKRSNGNCEEGERFGDRKSWGRNEGRDSYRAGNDSRGRTFGERQYRRRSNFESNKFYTDRNDDLETRGFRDRESSVWKKSSGLEYDDGNNESKWKQGWDEQDSTDPVQTWGDAKDKKKKKENDEWDKNDKIKEEKIEEEKVEKEKKKISLEKIKKSKKTSPENEKVKKKAKKQKEKKKKKKDKKEKKSKKEKKNKKSKNEEKKLNLPRKEKSLKESSANESLENQKKTSDVDDGLKNKAPQEENSKLDNNTKDSKSVLESDTLKSLNEKKKIFSESTDEMIFKKFEKLIYDQANEIKKIEATKKLSTKTIEFIKLFCVETAEERKNHKVYQKVLALLKTNMESNQAVELIIKEFSGNNLDSSLKLILLFKPFIDQRDREKIRDMILNKGIDKDVVESFLKD